MTNEGINGGIPDTGQMITRKKSKKGLKRGRHPQKALSAAFVRNRKEPGRYCDGNGLYLLVTPTGSRCWVQRLAIRGRRRELGLGGFPLVSLAEAREKAFTNRKLAREGGDPLAERRTAQAVPTVKEATGKVIEMHRKGWKPGGKSEAQWRASLTEYVFPSLGRLLVSDVSTADVMGVLTPIWHEKPETARRVRQRIGAIMKWSVAQGYRQDNPAGDAIGAALPRHNSLKKHFPAIPHSEVADALEKVRNSAASLSAKLAFEFLVLTACRSGEVRLARWEEIDLANGIWTIPADRMKVKRAHRVPLPSRVLEVLRDAHMLADASGLVFPGTKYGKPLSDATLSKLLRELGIAAVPHGFRSSFRDWAAECTDAPRFVMESALAHVVKDKAEAAYARSDLFERRRELMENWARYLSVETVLAEARRG